MLGSNPVRDDPGTSSQSMLFLAIAFLSHRVGSCSTKDDPVAFFLPPSSCYTTYRDSTRLSPGANGANSGCNAIVRAPINPMSV